MYHCSTYDEEDLMRAYRYRLLIASGLGLCAVWLIWAAPLNRTAAAPGPNATSGLSISFVGSIGGAAQAIAVDGTRAYLGEDTAIFDVR